MGTTIYQVDAFTRQPFGGNPAGVCLTPEPREERWMQSVAAEMNLSETAFLQPRNGAFHLRWFTPTVEVALCGHATLASAHILWECRVLGPDDPAQFDTLSGRLTARKCGEDIQMDFPATPVEPASVPAGLIEALGTPAKFVGKTRFDYLLELENEGCLRNLRPNFSQLAVLPVRGIIVTSRSDNPQFDFVSRFFAPAAGVNEDPVTGSAHCALGPFWQARLGRNDLTGYQASRRGGVVRVEVHGNRVMLSGHAVTIIKGELL